MHLTVSYLLRCCALGAKNLQRALKFAHRWGGWPYGCSWEGRESGEPTPLKFQIGD